MCMEEHIFCQKRDYEQAVHRKEPKRLSMKWKRTDIPVKKKLWAQQSVKKVMLTVLWDMKRLITIDFLEKGATENSGSNC